MSRELLSERMMYGFEEVVLLSGGEGDGRNSSDEIKREVGELFLKYMREMIYDSECEGFSSKDKKGIVNLINDMVKFKRG